MRLSRFLVSGVFLAALLLSAPASAAAQSMFDPIIPEACKCANVQVLDADGNPTGDRSPSAANWGCVLLVLQNVINTAVGIAVIVIVLAIAYAGFIFMTRGANPGAREQGKNVLTNAIVGLLVLLGAWLFVDFVMKVAYNQNAVFSGNTQLGPWNAIWSSSGDDMCLVVREPKPITSGILTIPFTSSGEYDRISADGPGACSIANVQAAAVEAGISLPANVAGYLACIARPESTCSANMQNYSWNKANAQGNASTAYGHFQVLLGSNSRHYENEACYRAAGVSGPLNCDLAFTKQGFTIPSESARLRRCQRASANLACSTAAAYSLYQVQGSAAWDQNRDSKVMHRRCAATYLR